MKIMKKVLFDFYIKDTLGKGRVKIEFVKQAVSWKQAWLKFGKRRKEKKQIETGNFC